MNAREQDLGVRDACQRVTLRRVLNGRVRCLIGGEICDRGRPVPGYVTEALRELAADEHVRFVAEPSGGTLAVVTPEGLALFEELSASQAAVGSEVSPRLRLHRAPRPAEDRTRLLGADAVRTRWPLLAFVVDASPPWTFRETVGQALTASRTRGDRDESWWVIDEHRTGYVCRRPSESAFDPECSFRGSVTWLAALLDVSSRVDGGR